MFIMTNIKLENGSIIDDIELEATSCEDAEKEAEMIAEDPIDSDDIPDWDCDEHAYLQIDSFEIVEK